MDATKKNFYHALEKKFLHTDKKSGRDKKNFYTALEKKIYTHR
jgi:hypothetical protein